MHLSLPIFTALLLAIANASPIVLDVAANDITKIEARGVQVASLEPRQTIGPSADEFTSGGCRSVILIYARGSTQAGNMGEQPGPQTANALKSALGSSVVAAQGVTYPAGLLSNLKTGGCDPDDAADMAALITQAATQCPSAKIVVSGYSQGAAMVHRSVEQLSTAVKARIYADVTYGDTQKEQDGARILSFDTSKTLILCNEGDQVCEGTLIITSAHFDYTGSVDTAVGFMRSKLGL
ncbi:cutinase [Pseudomassariella vexata]|uniref:Cutinase n=1 Tax=Pseudomassariella vexata TaxID=1141098 RepID=A0A1Y2DND0_9PEZI|nr:cutinase [Pseudomassariella vexata]ORY60679.1 cutinase [Pseudomassariella vexata]